MMTSQLSCSERQEYEQALSAYEEQLADYRARIAHYEAQLELAQHDGLTGAWLRHAGRRLLEEELQRTDRLGGSLTIAFVDVDGLKKLNDRHGHATGDEALVTVARALIHGLRAYDRVVRWGGDEFLCVLPGVTADEARRRLGQTREFLAAQGRRLSISVGVAERAAGEGLDSLVTRADRALYESRGRRLSC